VLCLHPADPAHSPLTWFVPRTARGSTGVVSSDYRPMSATENTPSSTSSLVSRSTRASCASRSTTPSVCPGVSASHCNVRGHKDPAKPCCFQKGCCNPDCPGNDGSVGTFGHGATATSIEAFIVWIRRANNVDLVFPPPTGVTRESLGCGCLCPQCFGEFRKFKRGFVSTDLASTATATGNVCTKIGATAQPAKEASHPPSLVSSCVCCDAERDFTGHQDCPHCNSRKGRSADMDRGSHIHRHACDRCVFLLRDSVPDAETWSNGSSKRGLSLSGENALGFNARCFVTRRCNHDVNWVFSSWLNDRMHHVAVETGKLRVCSPAITRGKPMLCRHHSKRFQESEEGLAAAKIERALAHYERYFIGSPDSGKRPSSAPFTTHEAAAVDTVLRSDRELDVVQSAAWALRRVYSFVPTTWGDYIANFRERVQGTSERDQSRHVATSVSDVPIAKIQTIFSGSCRRSVSMATGTSSPMMW
jgi:hypothetical protein